MAETTRSFRKLLDHNTIPQLTTELVDFSKLFMEYNSPPMQATYVISKQIYLENLTARINLPSFLKAPFPDLLPEMSSGEKYAALMEIEDKYPYLGLQFVIRKDGGEWMQTGIMSRPGNKGRESLLPILQPNLTPNLVKLLDPGEALGVRLLDLGFGVLKFGDSILIEGEFRIAVDLVARPISNTITTPPVPFGKFEIGDGSRMIKDANLNRQLIYICNTGANPCWLSNQYGAEVGVGVFLGAGGSFWSDRGSGVITSAFYGRCEIGKPTTLSGMEG